MYGDGWKIKSTSSMGCLVTKGLLGGQGGGSGDIYVYCNRVRTMPVYIYTKHNAWCTPPPTSSFHLHCFLSYHFSVFFSFFFFSFLVFSRVYLVWRKNAWWVNIKLLSINANIDLGTTEMRSPIVSLC